MSLKNFLIKSAIAIIPLGMFGCQKMSKPVLPSDYPKDGSSLIPGDLRFFLSFDSTSTDAKQLNIRFADSISGYPCFFPDPSTTAIPGVQGTAYQGSASTSLQYLNANDFPAATSFTIALWVKKTPQAAGQGTNFAFALTSKGYSWTNIELFLEFEDAGNPSTVDSAAAKLYIQDQWFEFIKNNSKDTRMPKVLDGQWHHLAFTYDETTSKVLTYIDGTLYLASRSDLTDVTNNGSPRGKLSFSGIDGFWLGGPGATAHTANTWMGDFDGAIDQFRLYNKALSASDVQALYANKQ